MKNHDDAVVAHREKQDRLRKERTERMKRERAERFQWNRQLQKQMEDTWRYAFHKATAEHD
jgi:hypothetical protein